MGDYIKNMVMVFVPKEQKSMVPTIINSLKGEGRPFDFNRIMPCGQGGGLASAIVDVMKNNEKGDNHIKVDEDRLALIRDKRENKWGCESNAIFWEKEPEEGVPDVQWTEELADHYGYDDQPCSIKINWSFDTKNGIPQELAQKFVRHAANLGLGAAWFYSSESKWDPSRDENMSVWEELEQSPPLEISATQLVKNANTHDNLFLLEDE